MKSIDWKEYISQKPTLDPTLIKPFHEEIKNLNSSLRVEIEDLKSQQKIEIERLKSHKILELDHVIKRHFQQLKSLEEVHEEEINSLKKEQQQKINNATMQSAMQSAIKKSEKSEKFKYSLSLGSIIPKFYHVDFQIFSEIQHDLDNIDFNGRVNYLQEIKSLPETVFFKESEKSTEFIYTSLDDQLRKIQDQNLDHGDFFISRHSNLSSQVVFHLIHDDKAPGKIIIIFT